MWDARGTTASGNTQTTHDLGDWWQIRWILMALNWKPTNPIVPGKKGAVVLLFVRAEDHAEAIEQALQWSQQLQGHAAGIIDTDLCVEGPSEHLATTN
jgi:hypothetical protein